MKTRNTIILYFKQEGGKLRIFETQRHWLKKIEGVKVKKEKSIWREATGRYFKALKQLLFRGG